MSNNKEQFRPYAAPSNVIAVIDRARTRNLPETVNNEFLRIAGVPEAVFGRVMQALRFLNLVHEDGRPTETLEALAGSKESEYRELLEKAIRDAYRAEFSMIDPGQDPLPAILDAFQPYQPRSQTSRMVMLFLQLCREAGIPVADAPRERRMKAEQARKVRATPRPRAIETSTGARSESTPRMRDYATSPPIASSLLFGVTEDDIGALSDTEFQEVWSALGKVARARARAKEETNEEATEETEEPTEE